MTDDTKPCAVCGQPMSRRPDENRSRFRRRRYCSHDCAYAGRRHAAPEHPPCEHCGGEVLMRRGEGQRKYLSRRFCSKDCAYAHQRDTRVVCSVAGCDKTAGSKGMCLRHYNSEWKRQRRAEADYVAPPPKPRHPPIRCVFCEAVKVCAWRGYDADETAEAMGKPLAWIRAHLKACKKERVA